MLQFHLAGVNDSPNRIMNAFFRLEKCYVEIAGEHAKDTREDCHSMVIFQTAIAMPSIFAKIVTVKSQKLPRSSWCRSGVREAFHVKHCRHDNCHECTHTAEECPVRTAILFGVSTRAGRGFLSHIPRQYGVAEMTLRGSMSGKRPPVQFFILLRQRSHYPLCGCRLF